MLQEATKPELRFSVTFWHVLMLTFAFWVHALFRSLPFRYQ